MAGCFHDAAARDFFARRRTDDTVVALECDTFDSMFERLDTDPSLLGIMAIENTIAGALLQNHELLRRSSLTIVGEHKMRISHVLAALPGQTILNPGDGVLVPDPGYPAYSGASRLVGAEIFSYNLTEANRWQPDFDELERMPLDRIKLMWVNYPHMPTGAPADYSVFERLVDFGRRHGIVISSAPTAAAISAYLYVPTNGISAGLSNV